MRILGRAAVWRPPGAWPCVGAGVAVAALGLHHVALVQEAGVEPRVAGGGVGAGLQDARPTMENSWEPVDAP